MYDVSWQWCMLWLLYSYCILHNLSTLPWVLMLVNIAGEHCCVLAVSHHISTKHPSLYNVTRVRVRFGFIVIICFDSCNTLILIEIRITLKNYILQKQTYLTLHCTICVISDRCVSYTILTDLGSFPHIYYWTHTMY